MRKNTRKMQHLQILVNKEFQEEKGGSFVSHAACRSGPTKMKRWPEFHTTDVTSDFKNNHFRGEEEA